MNTTLVELPVFYSFVDQVNPFVLELVSPAIEIKNDKNILSWSDLPGLNGDYDNDYGEEEEISPSQKRMKVQEKTIDNEEILNGFDFTIVIDRFMRMNPDMSFIGPILLEREYKRFLLLKMKCFDLLDSKIYSSPVIKQLWHSHILDIDSYECLFQLIGMKFRSNLEFEFDENTTKTYKYISTVNSYFEEFDEEPNELVWAINSLSEEEITTEERNQSFFDICDNPPEKPRPFSRLSNNSPCTMLPTQVNPRHANLLEEHQQREYETQIMNTISQCWHPVNLI